MVDWLASTRLNLTTENKKPVKKTTIRINRVPTLPSWQIDQEIEKTTQEEFTFLQTINIKHLISIRLLLFLFLLCTPICPFANIEALAACTGFSYCCYYCYCCCYLLAS